jgi:HK97 family phage prohead protease
MGKSDEKADPKGSVITAVAKLIDAGTTEVETRVVRFRFSDGSEDRVGDTIDPKGWKLEAFKSNPIALFNHSYDKVIGKCTRLYRGDGFLDGEIEFATADVSPLGDEIFKLVKGGFLNAVSVGFSPIDYEIRRDVDGYFAGFHFIAQELLEISVVSVPCLRSALVQARSAGVDTTAVRAHLRALAEERSDAELRALLDEGKPQVARNRRETGADGVTRVIDPDGVVVGTVRADGGLDISPDYQRALAERNAASVPAGSAVAHRPAPEVAPPIVVEPIAPDHPKDMPAKGAPRRLWMKMQARRHSAMLALTDAG